MKMVYMNNVCRDNVGDGCKRIVPVFQGEEAIYCEVSYYIVLHASI